jgi:hypothetical protein
VTYVSRAGTLIKERLRSSSKALLCSIAGGT